MSMFGEICAQVVPAGDHYPAVCLQGRSSAYRFLTRSIALRELWFPFLMVCQTLPVTWLLGCISMWSL